MDTQTLPGHEYYTVGEDEDISDSEKTIGMEKFVPKVLIWHAIFTCGMKSSTVFTFNTINAEIYRIK